MPVVIIYTTSSNDCVRPEIKMARLSPFFETDRFILKPTRLSDFRINQSKSGEHSCLEYRFPLTLEQLYGSCSDQKTCASNNGDSSRSRQLQLCISYVGKGNTAEEQFNLYPMGLSVQLNGNKFPMIWNDGGGLQPFNLARSVKKVNEDGDNLLEMIWFDGVDPCQFAMSIAVVDRLTPKELLEKMRKKPTISRTMLIVKKMTQTPVNDDVVICDPQNVRLSMTCPISRVRMTYPCRSNACNHLRCFDALAFIKLNEQLPKFLCPVCDVLLRFEDLRICSFLSKVLKHLPKDGGDDIELAPDGTWKQVEPVEVTKVSNCEGADNHNRTSPIEMVDLTHDVYSIAHDYEDNQIEIITIFD